jgi:hypothetical protein
MKPTIPIAVLLATTAMATGAYAQAQEGEATGGELIAECQEMLTFVQENDVERTGMTQDRADRIARANNPQYCDDAMRIAQGEISDQESAQNYDAEAAARLLVAVPEPEVTITQDAPDVAVEQLPPEVRVDPGQPTVTVQQGEPVVHVEMPQPRITIDMPKPRILVEMPDPTVDVAMREPRVTVDQGQPEVQVEQGQPEIQVNEQALEAESQGEAEVQLEQGQATVQLEQPDAAEVEIGQVRPNVRYEAAEPRVEFADAGEPEISFNQPGEAEVQFRQLTAEETRAMAEQGEAGQQETAQATAEAPEGAAGDTGNMRVVESAGVQDGGGERQPFSVQDVLDMQVVGADGEEIGEVEDIVMRGDQPYVVVGHGGFLGLGEEQVALPLQDMRLRDGQLVMRDVTQEEIEQLQDVNTDEMGTADPASEVELIVE